MERREMFTLEKVFKNYKCFGEKTVPREMGRAGGEEGRKDVCMFAACADLSITFAYKIYKIRSDSDKSIQKERLTAAFKYYLKFSQKEQQAVQKQQC